MQHKYVKKSSRGKVLVTVLTAILLVLVVICAGMLWHVGSAKRDFQKLSQQVSAAVPTTQEKPSESKAGPTETDATEETVPATQPPQEKTILPQYEQLHQQNPEFFGWLTIPGTRIDYPVMYSPEEPQKYIHADFDGNYSYPGTPFLDGHCEENSENYPGTRIDYPVMYSPEEPQKYIHADFDGNYSYPGTPFLDGHCEENSENYIIYAHNMLDGSMFRSLMKYENKAYWEKHPTIQFNTLYEEGEYEVLAAFYDKVYKKTDNVFKFYQFINAADQEDFDAAMAAYREKQLYRCRHGSLPGKAALRHRRNGPVRRSAAHPGHLRLPHRKRPLRSSSPPGSQWLLTVTRLLRLPTLALPLGELAANTLVTCAYHTENGRFVVVARRAASGC